MSNHFAKTLFRAVRAVFYQVVFGRSWPFEERLARILYGWERRYRTGDIPIARGVLEAHYRRGRWSNLGNLDELARYSVIAGYLHYLKPGGAVLDVGCGEGFLFRRYRPYGYAKYVGVDVLAGAVEKLSQEQDEKTRFVCADAEVYEPAEVFDAIVFNEVLYYLEKPLDVVERYVRALKEGGIVVLSTYAPSERAMAILRRTKARYPLLDEVRITNEAKTWICSVLVPFT